MEIERKFLVKEGHNIDGLLYTNKSIIEDYYLDDFTRIRNIDGRWKITIKGEGTKVRDELEKDLSIDYLPNVGNIKPIKKVRIKIPYNNHNFEINVFDNIYYKGTKLIIIEVELNDEKERVDLPEWVGEEITDSDIFYGRSLRHLVKFSNFVVK